MDHQLNGGFKVASVLLNWASRRALPNPQVPATGSFQDEARLGGRRASPTVLQGLGYGGCRTWPDKSPAEHSGGMHSIAVINPPVPVWRQIENRCVLKFLSQDIAGRFQFQHIVRLSLRDVVTVTASRGKRAAALSRDRPRDADPVRVRQNKNRAREYPSFPTAFCWTVLSSRAPVT
jgi:hypothetical protein